MTARPFVDGWTSCHPAVSGGLAYGYYQLFLGRNAETPLAVQAYVAELQTGTPDETVIAQFLGSPEFFNLAQTI